MHRRPSALLRGTIALLVYSLLTLVYLRPIWETYADHLTPDAGDPLFNLYILKWVGHAARCGFSGLWDAPFFYPTRGALALSDHLIGPGLAIAWLPSPVAGYNLLLVAAFVLSGLAAWWVLEAGGCSFAAALLGGAMFAFAPYRWSQLNHIQILLAQWLPLTLWAWDRLLAERTARRAAIFLAFYALHVLGGCYLAYMIHVPLAMLLASRWAAEGRELVSRRALRVLLPAAAAAAALVAAIFVPYVLAARSLSLAHGAEEVAKNGAALASYLSPPARTWLSPVQTLARLSQAERWRRPFMRAENALFPGLAASLLGALGLWDLWRRHRRPAAALPVRRRAVLLALAGLAAALYVLGDVYTLGFDHGTFLGPWLPWATTGLWNALGTAFLAALGAWLWLRHRWGAGRIDWRSMDPWERGLAISGVACFLLSHPLVYMPLMRAVPGMSGMRVPARFATIVLWSLVFFAARGLDGLLDRIAPPGRERTSPGGEERISPGRRRPVLRAAVLAVLAAGLAFEVAPRPLHWVYVPRESDFPEVYRWLAAQRDIGALLDVPLRRNARETRTMYFSTAGWRPIVNGFSGFVPPSHEELADRIGWLPDAAGLDLLRSLGVTHLVVRPPAVAGAREWEQSLAGRADLVHASEDGRVYRLR